MENKISNFKNNKNIVVVMRGTSAVTFHKKTNLLVQNIQSSIGPVNITYTTRWLKKKDGIVTPGHIWIEGTYLRYIDANGDERYAPL